MGRGCRGRGGWCFRITMSAALERLLREDLGEGQKFVVVESLFSMDGDKAPLAEYVALCRSTGAALIVDEAHAVGVYGEHGEGLAHDVFLSINTAGKAMGVSGAFVAGSSGRDRVLDSARAAVYFFDGSSAGDCRGAGG